LFLTLGLVIWGRPREFSPNRRDPRRAETVDEGWRTRDPKRSEDELQTSRKIPLDNRIGEIDFHATFRDVHNVQSLTMRRIRVGFFSWANQDGKLGAESPLG